MELHREHVKHGRYFLDEIPAYATSWQETAVKDLAGVVTATCDQFRHECTAEDGLPVKKPTTLMTSQVRGPRRRMPRA